MGCADFLADVFTAAAGLFLLLFLKLPDFELRLVSWVFSLVYIADYIPLCVVARILVRRYVCVVTCESCDGIHQVPNVPFF